VENAITPETVVTESAPEATLPVVETVKTEVVAETPVAPTTADFNALTAAQQGEVMRELAKLKTQDNGESGKALYPNRRKEVDAPTPTVAKEEPVATEAPAKTEEEDADEEAKDAKGKQFRLRGKDQKENDVLALVRGGRTMQDAYRMIYGDTKTEETVAAKEEPSVEATFDKEISALQAEIAKLEKEQEAAADEADVAKALKVARQITAKERAIENKQMAKDLAVSEQQQTVAQAAAQKEADIAKADHASVIEDYPELGDKSSAERKKFEEFIRERQNDPRYEGKFASLHWRSTLAHEFAAKTGLKPAALRTAFEPPAAGKTTPAKTTPPPAAKTASQATAAKALTTRDAPSSDTFELTPDQAVKDFGNLTLKQQTEVLRELDKIKRAKNPRAA